MSLVSVKSLQSLSSRSDTRPAQVRVRLKIPKHYRNDPILSTLVNQHQITINILSALSCLRYLVCVVGRR
jgi:ABC-type methionine transport system ATPase subunit